MAIYVSVCEIVCVFQLNYLALPKRCFCIYTYGNFCQIPAFWLSEPCRVSPRGPAELCVCPCSSSAAGFDVRPEPPPSPPSSSLSHIMHALSYACKIACMLCTCCHTYRYLYQADIYICMCWCLCCHICWVQWMYSICTLPRVTLT